MARDPVSVHDFHATIQHLLGIDHEALTFAFQGRNYRLTDVEGEVRTGAARLRTPGYLRPTRSIPLPWKG